MKTQKTMLLSSFVLPRKSLCNLDTADHPTGPRLPAPSRKLMPLQVAPSAPEQRRSLPG
jgi:hypothetical protein